MTAYGIFASESTWGTVPASGWRGLEIESDDHKSTQDVLAYKGLSATRGAPRGALERITKRKGTGTVSMPALSNGQGIFWRAAASTAASAVKVGGTLAYQQDYTWTGAGPPLNRSISSEIYRDRYTAGTFDAFTYPGGRCTGVDIDQSADGFVMLKFGMDYKPTVLQGSDPSRTVAEVVPDLIYSWEDARFTMGPVGDTQVADCMQSGSLSLPANMEVDKWCVNRGTSRHQPRRKGTPEPTGTLTWDYDDPKFYNAFRNGTDFSLKIDWVGSTAIESTTYPSLTIELPLIRFSGEDPQGAVDDVVSQSLPFRVLQNEDDDPIATVTIITSDTTF